MRIALDAMGGDQAPTEPVAGAVLAARELGIPVTLVGPHAVVTAELARHRCESLPVDIVDAPDQIDMAEHPVQAVRRRPGASMNVGIRLVKEGQADAFVTAGNTGAAVVAGLFGLGRLPSVERPALATVFPTAKGHCLILDVGANSDCRPHHLMQFAMMGDRYARTVLKIPLPRVGLLSNGEEESKGNLVVQEAHQLLKGADLNFVGNVEGKDVPRGLTDVVVCDGFVGNVLVKLAEGIGEFTFSLLREEISASPIGILGALLLRPALRRIKHRVDYEEYGGAPVLGLNGVVIVAHGRSRARAIRNAIRVAAQAIEGDLTGALARSPLAAQSRIPPVRAEGGC
ncbi:MAG TPA: phosphate acyltransferase PlsX [Chloroflexota bacterium]|nr:phosphate acyltransferase PlsX [Chloroflexota bacterium]